MKGTGWLEPLDPPRKVNTPLQRYIPRYIRSRLRLRFFGLRWHAEPDGLASVSTVTRMKYHLMSMLRLSNRLHTSFSQLYVAEIGTKRDTIHYHTILLWSCKIIIIFYYCHARFIFTYYYFITMVHLGVLLRPPRNVLWYTLLILLLLLFPVCGEHIIYYYYLSGPFH